MSDAALAAIIRAVSELTALIAELSRGDILTPEQRELLRQATLDNERRAAEILAD